MTGIDKDLDEMQAIVEGKCMTCYHGGEVLSIHKGIPWKREPGEYLGNKPYTMDYADYCVECDKLRDDRFPDGYWIRESDR